MLTFRFQYVRVLPAAGHGWRFWYPSVNDIKFYGIAVLLANLFQTLRQAALNVGHDCDACAPPHFLKARKRVGQGELRLGMYGLNGGKQSGIEHLLYFFN